MANSGSDNINLSFGGTGSLGVYQIGVAMAFHRHGQKALEKTGNFAGASAGAIVSALLLTAPNKIQPFLAGTRKLVDDIYKSKGMTPAYDFTSRIKRLLKIQLPKDAYTKIGDKKLHIKVITFERKRDPLFDVNDPAEWRKMGKKAWKTFVDIHEFSEEVISDFGSNDELVEVLIGSVHIPIHGGVKHPVYRGKKLMDPGLRIHLPDCSIDVSPEIIHVETSNFASGKTITVSSLHSDEVSISPSKNKGEDPKIGDTHGQPIDLTKWNYLYAQDAYHPAPWDNLKEYYVRGYEDCKMYLMQEELFSK
ncbi:patatin-like phospholipase domain-containing protein 4 [Saccoglossus kowalevskii]|uniref:Patatin-like phospholipase domain-containing protein 4-like n=1 Tax=Saccoglossus kowalevskii TaxID=10224 RepID=A0ABM0LUX6_SACKO|nr:PREDICTED: patatin-like phospholipase domain-containing protein 4-like [Saccoglossus kowalevskii]